MGSKVPLENWIYLRWHTNASEYPHLVGQSDPISSCSIGLLQMVSGVSKREQCDPFQPSARLSCAQLYRLHSFYTAAPRKMLGNQGCA